MTESFKAHLTAQENNEEQREVYGVARIADAYAKIQSSSKLKYKCWDEENEMWRYSTDEDTEFIFRNGKWHVTYTTEINVNPDGIEMDVPVLREVEEPEVICL